MTVKPWKVCLCHFNFKRHELYVSTVLKKGRRKKTLWSSNQGCLYYYHYNDRLNYCAKVTDKIVWNLKNTRKILRENVYPITNRVK